MFIKLENKVFLGVALIAVTFLSFAAYQQITGQLSLERMVVQLPPEQPIMKNLQVDSSAMFSKVFNKVEFELNSLRSEIQQLKATIQQLNERIARLEQRANQQSGSCSDCEGVFRSMMGGCQQVTTLANVQCASTCQRNGKVCTAAYIESYRTSDSSQYSREPTSCNVGVTFGDAFTARAHCTCC